MLLVVWQLLGILLLWLRLILYAGHLSEGSVLYDLLLASSRRLLKLLKLL